MSKILKSCFVIGSCFLLGANELKAQTASKAPAKPVAKTTTAKPTPKPSVATAKPSAEVVKEIQLKSTLDSVAYSIGLNIGATLKMQGLAGINTAVLEEGIRHAAKADGKERFSPEVANQVMMSHFKKMEDSVRVAESAKAEPNRLAGEKFLEENKKRTGVVTTNSGLQYEVITMGQGPKPTLSDQVRAHYTGTLVDGTVFDSSVERGEPIVFPVTGVIKGWTEALQLMPVGSKWKLYIPYTLGYGERAAGPKIGAMSALIFEVELLEILKSE